MEQSAYSKPPRLVLRNKNPEVNCAGMTKNYYTKRFNPSETTVPRKFTEQEARNIAIHLKWYKVYEPQFIFEVSPLIRSTLLTFDRFSSLLDMQPNSPAEICSGGFRKTFNAYLAMNRLPLNRIQPNADAHLVIFTMDNRGSLAAGNFAVHG